MKKLILLFITTFVLSCCNNDDNHNEQLPPETQTGANTVGCLVNGNVFLPHAEGINPEVNCFYQYIDGEFFFNIAFFDYRGTTPKAVSVQTRQIDLQVGETYLLNKNVIDDGDFIGGGGNFDIGASNRYFTSVVKTGELKITHLDLQNSIISGTFWFDAVNANGETVEIRQGRFDWNY